MYNIRASERYLRLKISYLKINAHNYTARAEIAFIEDDDDDDDVEKKSTTRAF